MTLRELEVLIRIELKEPIEANWSSIQLNHYINETLQYDIAPLAGQKDIFTRNVLANTAEVILPDDLLIPITMEWVEGSNRSRIEIGLITSDDIFSDIRGIPRMAWLLGNKLKLYPIPSSNGTLRMLGITRPPKLVNPDDRPIYRDVEQMIICGSVYKAYLSDNNPLADLWEKRFERAKYTYLDTKVKKPEHARVKDYWASLGREIL